MIKKSLYLILAIVLILPMVVIFYLSLVNHWSYPNIFEVHISWSLWAEFFSGNNNIFKSVFLSLFLSTIIASTATIFGFLVSQQLYEKPLFFKLAYFPYLIAPVVFGAMLQFYFTLIGLTGSFWGVLLAQILFVFPYSVLLFSTFWDERVRQTAFQSTTLGANTWEVFRTVLLPMSKPWIFLCFVQCFLISWYEYGITQLIGIGKIETLPIKTMLFIKEANPHLAALSACIMVFPIISFLLLNRQLFLKKEVTA